MKKAWSSKAGKRVLAAACAVMFLIGQKEICFADATGKVIPASAKIRASADINSEVVSSTSSGRTLTITGEVKDASGSLWYQVNVDANTKGYIRSDLINVDTSSGSIPTLTASDTSGTGNTDTVAGGTAAEGAEVPAETEMDAQYASVKVAAAKVRSGASTSKSIVDTLPENTQVVVSGQTNGSDGNVWYYINFTGTNGVEKTGYVRNDLINLGEMVPVDEPNESYQENSSETEPQEASSENNDYQLIYETNPDGEYEWYLYDNTGEQRTRQKLGEVLAAAHAKSLNSESDAKTVSRQRIVIVVLIALIMILAVVMTFMFFKLRDAYYEAYEDDEEEEAAPVRKKEETGRKREESGRRRSEVQEEKQSSVRKKEPLQEGRTSSSKKKTTGREKMPAREVTYEEEPAVHVKTQPKRKAKNFLLEDEEFEFEFLNMKDNKGM